MIYIYLLMVLFAFIYAGIKLRNSSFSKEIVSTIYVRYIVATIAFIGCNIYYYIPYVMIIFHPDRFNHDTHNFIETKDPNWFICFTKLLFMFQGFILPFARFSEPVFSKIIKKSVMHYICCCNENKTATQQK